MYFVAACARTPGQLLGRVTRRLHVVQQRQRNPSVRTNDDVSRQPLVAPERDGQDVADADDEAGRQRRMRPVPRFRSRAGIAELLRRCRC